jgi:mono/diheme cytochrome c family protein
MKSKIKRACLASGLLLLTACRQDMHDQPRYKPLRASDFFGDGRSARPLVTGVVARGTLHDNELLYTGKAGGSPAETFPFPLTREILQRGRERFNIYCSPCHDRAGTGNGMVVRRGFRPPPSFHTDHLRNAAPGHVFDVITNGFGAMASYGDRVPPHDRWAIIAYIRALQMSQYSRVADLAEQDRTQLAGTGQ